MSENKNNGSLVSLDDKIKSDPETQQRVYDAVKEAVKDKTYKIPSIINNPHEAAAVKALGALPDYRANNAIPLLDSLPSKDDVETLTAMAKIHAEWFAKKQLEHIKAATELIGFISESFEKLYQEFGEEEYKKRLSILEEIEQKMLIWYEDSHPTNLTSIQANDWIERVKKEGSFAPFGYPEENDD